jgi:hypothetical protein
MAWLTLSMEQEARVLAKGRAQSRGQRITELELMLSQMKGYEVGYASYKQSFPPHKPGKVLL